MPIISTHELGRNKHKLKYGEHDGLIRNLVTGEETKFIQRAGVYFIKLFFKKDEVGNPSLGFARQG